MMRAFRTTRAVCGWLGMLAWSASTSFGQLSIEQDERTVSIRRGEQTVLVYNVQPPDLPAEMDAIYRRDGFIHPVRTPSGEVVTDAYPVDHAHQSGIFGAWVSTRFRDQSVDFWNLQKREGRVVHADVLAAEVTADRAELQVALRHRADFDPPVDVLYERMTITVCDRGDEYHVFDIATEQTALSNDPLLIQKYHYGGLALRSRYQKDQPELDSVRPFLMQNEHGASPSEGNHQPTRWVAVSGDIGSQSIHVVVLSDPQNFRAPQPARLHPSMPYFCFAPCVTDPFVIDRDHPYRARYRFLVRDGQPDTDWIEDQWDRWISPQGGEPGK